MKHLIVAFFLCVTSIMWCGNAEATYPLASDISGTVVDDNKNPIVGAVVEIRHVETGRVITRRTNKKGHYIAWNVRPDGTYIVRVKDPSGQRASVTFPASEVLLGERMRRNAVLLITPDVKPDFMRSWIWHQPASDTPTSDEIDLVESALNFKSRLKSQWLSEARNNDFTKPVASP